MNHSKVNNNGKSTHNLLLLAIILIIIVHVSLTASGSDNAAWNANGDPLKYSISNIADNGYRSTGNLSFNDRMECQRAIEKVYWNHQIWPKQNKEPKPSFEAIMTAEMIRAKVEQALQRSNALSIYWNKPITGEQLQNEINRMASNTRSP